MSLVRLLFLGVVIIFSTGCAHKPASGALKLPHEQTAFVESIQVNRPGLFSSKGFYVTWIDGADLSHQKEKSQVFGGFRLLPGKHTIGVIAEYGDLCIPSPLGGACFNYCFSGIALTLEAGRRYSYNINSTQIEVFVNVIDDTGKVVSDGICVPCTLGICGTEQQKSIMEGLEN